MYFTPTQDTSLLTEAQFPQGIADITSKLDACRHEGYFDSFDGKPLYYEYYLVQGSRASVVLLHGLSEFTKKFYEITYYLLQRGYNVFMYDQRCHGKSCRLTEQAHLLHVDCFDHYVRDLEQFMQQVVHKVSQLPLYLYAHSMGGAVAAMYLAKNRETVCKAVLSAPLIDPVVNTRNAATARFLVRMLRLKHGSKGRFLFSRDFDPQTPFRPESDGSAVRFAHNMRLRSEDERYQTSPMSIGWVLSSLKVRSALLKKRVTKGIQTPVLLISAEKDRVVKTDAHYAFADRCDACTLVSIPQATHAMLAGTDEILQRHIGLVTEFFGA